MFVESEIKRVGGGRDALTSQKNKKRGKTLIGSSSSSPLLSLYYTWGNQKRKRAQNMWGGEPLKRARGNLERFGYSGTSEEVSIKYGRYGLLCFFLCTRYTRIHMNMMYDPNTPHFLICLQVSHTFGHQGLIRVTFLLPRERKKERKKAWLSCGCGPSVLCVMNEWQKWDLKSYSPILFWDVMSLSSPLISSPP